MYSIIPRSLYPRERTQIPTEEAAGWVSEPVRTLWGTEKSLVYIGNRTFPCGLVTVPTKPSLSVLNVIYKHFPAHSWQYLCSSTVLPKLRACGPVKYFESKHFWNHDGCRSMTIHANTDRLLLLRGTRRGCWMQEQMSQLIRRLREEVGGSPLTPFLVRKYLHIGEIIKNVTRH
jgi:hypothetical protein